MTGYKPTVAICLKDVDKDYPLHSEKPTFSERFFFRHQIKMVRALQKINFEIVKGEKVGILGLNGSGKTTLLKIISGITNPSSGKVFVNGHLVSLVDLEAGLEDDLTGSQNIYLFGLLIGMRKKEIKKKQNSIIRFSGLGKFINQPIHTYSTGMRLRLGFSVLVYSNPEILLLDEIIGAGDIKFQVKVSRKINQLFQSGQTVVISSHNIDFVRQTCNRIIVLEAGIVIADGGKEVVDWFTSHYLKEKI